MFCLALVVARLHNCVSGLVCSQNYVAEADKVIEERQTILNPVFHSMFDLWRKKSSCLVDYIANLVSFLGP